MGSLQFLSERVKLLDTAYTHYTDGKTSLAKTHVTFDLQDGMKKPLRRRRGPTYRSTEAQGCAPGVSFRAWQAEDCANQSQENSGSWRPHML